MTREEAVRRIKEIQKLYVFTPTINEALDLAIEALQEKHQLSRETSTNTPTCNQKQVTSKLKNPHDSLLKADSDECKEQKSKLEPEQMREYIPKGEVLDIIKSMPMDLVEEYVYELDGIWLDDDEEVDYCNNCPYISYSNEDCISRQQAVNAVENTDINITESEWDELISVIDNLPPVNQKQVQPKN